MGYYENEGDKVVARWFARHQTKLLILVVGIVAVLFLIDSYERNLCKQVCLSNDYNHFRFTPRARFKAYTCKCLTEEEADQTDKIPEGKRYEIYDS